MDISKATAEYAAYYGFIVGKPHTLEHIRMLLQKSKDFALEQFAEAKAKQREAFK